MTGEGALSRYLWRDPKLGADAEKELEKIGDKLRPRYLRAIRRTEEYPDTALPATRHDYRKWLENQPEWRKVVEKSEQNLENYKESLLKERMKTDNALEAEMIRRHGPDYKTYSAKTKRGLALVPIHNALADEIKKQRPVLAGIVRGLADPIIADGLQSIFTFLVEGGKEIALAVLKGNPKDALVEIAKKFSAPLAEALTATRQDLTPAAEVIRAVANKIAGKD